MNRITIEEFWSQGRLMLSTIINDITENKARLQLTDFDIRKLKDLYVKISVKIREYQEASVIGFRRKTTLS